MSNINIARAIAKVIGTASLAALLAWPAVAAHDSSRHHPGQNRGPEWVVPETVNVKLAANATTNNRGHKDKTSVTRHEVHTFEFTLPCIDKGNPYQVTTTSDATVTIQKTLTTSGRHSETVLGFTDVGTYKALPKHGGRPISGWFFDTYTTVATDAKTGPDGTVTTAAHATNRRVLVLSNRSGGEFFREVISVDADNYNAATTPVNDDVTCGQEAHPK